MDSLKISIIGFGYVGLTTAVCFASEGLTVSGFDIDCDKITKIKDGRVPFKEPQTLDLLKISLGKRFTASCDKLELGDIVFITVGTPADKEGAINLSYVKDASEMIGTALKDWNSYCLIAVKSTVVPGTTESTIIPRIELKSGKKVGRDFGIAVNPEFLREGSAVRDMFEPDRLVIGGYDERSGDMLEELYRTFYRDRMPVLLRTNMVNAEFVKYANNAFLATKISFSNTLANIAQTVPGADVTIITRGIGLDNRIGSRFLNAGLGFGGSCLPKDVKALIAFSRHTGYNPIQLNATYEVNSGQPLVAVKLAERFLGNLRGRKVSLLGLSFKPDTDDIRDAVSMTIINDLLKEGATIIAYDPAAMENVSRILEDKIDYAKSALDALQDSDCCIVSTEWEEFEKLRPEDFVARMKTSIVIDGRRIYKRDVFEGKVDKFVAVGMGE